jgi:mycothiol system anti-sigma-R factor
VICATVRRHVGALVDGELDPASLLELERHVDGCPTCQESVAFERRFRALTQESLSTSGTPAGLRARIAMALDEADRAPHVHPSTDAPLSYKTIFVLASAAATVLILGGTLAGDGPNLASMGGGGAGVFDDVVRLHSSGLPSDIAADPLSSGPQTVTRYFQNKVQFPVHPTEFERSDVRFVGARLSNVQERRAAALFYDVRGARMTVVVFEAPSLDDGVQRVTLRGREIFVRNVHGHPVPVRRSGGLQYAFTGDLDRHSLLDVAASARVAP